MLESRHSRFLLNEAAAVRFAFFCSCSRLSCSNSFSQAIPSDFSRR
jgi:hypothetical protein